MPHLKLTIQYDGTEYAGWQRQDNGPSVQALLEDALARIEGGRVVLHGAGRTDAGVHALAQVATCALAVPIEPATLGRALNAVLPPDVRVLGVENVAPHFHARFSATAKIYEYRIINAPLVSPFVQRYAWHIRQPLDLDVMREAGRALLGTHDFAAFQGSGAKVRSTVRTVRAIDWDDGGGYDLPIVMRIEGDGFLRHMVRTVVGTLAEIGAGRSTVSRIPRILASGDRTEAGPTAPARGLFLVRVIY